MTLVLCESSFLVPVSDRTILFSVCSGEMPQSLVNDPRPPRRGDNHYFTIKE
jgi:hypothetical protein